MINGLDVSKGELHMFSLRIDPTGRGCSCSSRVGRKIRFLSEKDPDFHVAGGGWGAKEHSP